LGPPRPDAFGSPITLIKVEDSASLHSSHNDFVGGGKKLSQAVQPLTTVFISMGRPLADPTPFSA
jgi:hypothetical protein